MQYTLRNIPKGLDEALRRRAHDERKSLNRVAVEALLRAFGLVSEPKAQRSLGDVAGTWQSDSAVEGALADQRLIDEQMWT